MLIAVMSDSHNNRKAIDEAKAHLSEADMLLFLGDGEEDLEYITKDFKGEVYAVKGNCDITNNNPKELIIDILGKKILMCHGNRYGVKSNYNTIFYKGKECGVDIVLFGHSHVGMIEKIDTLTLMNPGSISHGYGMSKRSVGFIELIEGEAPRFYLKQLTNMYQ